ncbi:hypothetical protein JB92DRAFT_439437 [Gautieria morchelliformis]|nr:hypothetical protein JB92DRAFT_439437 [Gautieria morchelliformis]
MIHTGFPLLFLPWTMRVHARGFTIYYASTNLHKRRKKIKNNVLTSRLPSFPPVFVVLFQPPLQLFNVILRCVCKRLHKFKRREKNYFFFDSRLQLRHCLCASLCNFPKQEDSTVPLWAYFPSSAHLPVCSAHLPLCLAHHPLCSAHHPLFRLYIVATLKMQN